MGSTLKFSILSIFVFILSHIILSNLDSKKNFFKSGQILFFFLAIFFNFLSLSLISLFESVFHFIFFFLILNCFIYSYFHFYNMSETARRIKILLKIRNGNSLTLKDLRKDYDYINQIKIRLNRLILNGQIKKKNDNYVLNSNFLYLVAKLFNFLRKFF